MIWVGFFVYADSFTCLHVAAGVDAEGPGEGWGSPKRLDKALADNTKPQHTIQSPDGLYENLKY